MTHCAPLRQHIPRAGQIARRLVRRREHQDDRLTRIVAKVQRALKHLNCLGNLLGLQVQHGTFQSGFVRRVLRRQVLQRRCLGTEQSVRAVFGFRQQGKIVLGRLKRGIEFQGLGERGPRMRLLPERGSTHPQVVPDRFILRSAFDRFFKKLDCYGVIIQSDMTATKLPEKQRFVRMNIHRKLRIHGRILIIAPFVLNQR